MHTIPTEIEKGEINMDITRLGRFISLVLRHKPEEAHIVLDKNGWANVNDLISGVKETGREINMEILEEIVRTDNKGRFSFDENKTKIRANQGHSINVDVELKECVPPDVLYHGTATRFLNSIYEEGIRPMKRLYVHLSKDYETAVKVGERHGTPVVLEINAKKMYEDGYAFYLSQNGVWLTSTVTKKYIARQKY